MKTLLCFFGIPDPKSQHVKKKKRKGILSVTSLLKTKHQQKQSLRISNNTNI